MRTNHLRSSRTLCALVAGLLVLSVNGRLTADTPGAPSDRPVVDEQGMVELTYRDEPVHDAMLAFIAESTGKIVVPANLVELKARRITAITGAPVPRERALDVLYQAMRNNDIGVIQRETDVLIGTLPDIMSLRLLPVVPAEESVLDRGDHGTLVLKIFRLRNASADDVFDELAGGMLPGWSFLSVDRVSNQLMLAADVGLCQHVERLLAEIERHSGSTMKVYTLHYANAADVAETLSGLLEGRVPPTRSMRQNPTRGRGATQARSALPSEAIVGFRRVQVYAPANMVFVLGDGEALTMIDQAVAAMDQPTEAGLPFIIELEHADAKTLASALNLLLASPGVDRATPGGAAPDAPGRAPWMRDGREFDAGLENVLAGRVRIVAIERVNGLAVLCPASQADAIRELVTSLDRPE